jgi:hypothetical protein
VKKILKSAKHSKLKACELITGFQDFRVPGSEPALNILADNSTWALNHRDLLTIKASDFCLASSISLSKSSSYTKILADITKDW